MQDIQWLLFSVGLFVGAGLLIFASSYSFLTMYAPFRICFDCGKTAGFPFVMYNSGFIWGGEGYIPSGFFANAVFAFISGSVIGCVFSWHAKPRKRILK